MDDDAIRALVTRLARVQPSGAATIERAAILAVGADCEAVIAWIGRQGGTPEAAVPTSRRHGLHGSRLHADGSAEARAPARFVLPAGTLD